MMPTSDLLAELTPFLPCIDDADSLAVMSDIAESHRQQLFAEHLRWVAREWSEGKCLRRDECKEGLPVWFCMNGDAWSMAEIVECGQLVSIRFPRGEILVQHGQNLVLEPYLVSGRRAWWDLRLRASPETPLWGNRMAFVRRPKPRRKGPTLQANRLLARWLVGDASMPLTRLLKEYEAKKGESYADISGR